MYIIAVLPNTSKVNDLFLNQEIDYSGKYCIHIKLIKCNIKGVDNCWIG